MSSDDIIADHEPIEEKNEVNEQVRSFGFHRKTRKADLTLLVEGKRLYVNRSFLELASPVFEELLDNRSYKEENAVEINDTKHNDFAEFLACIYPSSVHEVSIENVHRILPLAFQYNIERLLVKCESILYQSTIEKKGNEEYLMDCTKDAKKYNMPNLKRHCIELIVQNRKKHIETVDEDLPLDSEDKDAVLQELLPYLRSAACKYMFWSTIVDNSDTCIRRTTKFKNAKYFKVEIKLFTFLLEAKECFSTEVWDTKFSVTTENATELGQKVLNFCVAITPDSGQDGSSISYDVVIRCVVKNNNPIKTDKSFQGYGRVTMNSTVTTSVSLQQIQSQELGFSWNGQYTFVVHLLINKP